MNPILTNMDQILFEKRDSAIQQANALTDLMQKLGITDPNEYKAATTEILTQAFPKTGSEVNTWSVDVKSGSESGGPGGF